MSLVLVVASMLVGPSPNATMTDPAGLEKVSAAQVSFPPRLRLRAPAPLFVNFHFSSERRRGAKKCASAHRNDHGDGAAEKAE